MTTGNPIGILGLPRIVGTLGMPGTLEILYSGNSRNTSNTGKVGNMVQMPGTLGMIETVGTAEML